MAGRHFLFAGILALILGGPAGASAQGYLQEGFGRFGRFHDDGLLTVNVFPDRFVTAAPSNNVEIRFAPEGVGAEVLSIDTTHKALRLEENSFGSQAVHYSLLYPGFSVEFGSEATLVINRANVTVNPIGFTANDDHAGLLILPSSGQLPPILIAFRQGIAPIWERETTAQTTRLTLSEPTGIGEVRFMTSEGITTVSSTTQINILTMYLGRASSWLPRGLPRLSDRQVDYDHESGTVTIRESFLGGGAEPIAPIPPVLAFAIDNGYPATIHGTVRSGNLSTKYGPFKWVDGTELVYTLPVPPTEERGYIAHGRDPEGAALLNGMVDRLGATWARNAVDLGYVGMTPAAMSWAWLTPQRRTQLQTAWATYLPLALALPPYPPSNTRDTWKWRTEPFSGLDYIWTYDITGGPGNSYSLDIEWGNMLPVYGVYKYAQYSGDWDFVRDHWETIKLITDYTDYGDDWAWMTNVNGDMGWSTGTGDPMTAAYAGHIAALKMARTIGDEEREKHYAYRAARVAVPMVSRLWYRESSVTAGLVPANHVVQGFWERSYFTSSLMDEATRDPWGPTNILSGNGAQPEVFAAFTQYASGALRSYQDRFLERYPNLFNGAHVYPFQTTYGGNSVYVTFPHLYARAFLGESTSSLYSRILTAESNRGTTGWSGVNVVAEILSRQSPLYLAQWEPAAYISGNYLADNSVRLGFSLSEVSDWTLEAELTTDMEFLGATINGTNVPATLDGNRLRLSTRISGEFTVTLQFDGVISCPDEVIVDDEFAGQFSTIGNWSTSANTPFIGSTSRIALGGNGANVARWSPVEMCAGVYDVYTSWVAAPNRGSAVSYVVNHDGGSSTVIVDQTTNGNRWNHLGRYTFSNATGNLVTVSDQGLPTNRYVSAEAVRFVRIAGADSDAWMMR